MNASTGLTCLACHLVFPSSQLQKEHYQSEWHRYNLKRQVSDLPPVTREQFEEKVSLFRNNEATVAKSDSISEKLFCAVCQKNFRTENAFTNHIQSKKHEEEEKRTKKRGPRQPKKKAAANEGEEEEELSDSDGDSSSASSEWKTDEGSDQEEEDLNESEALPPTLCLFCSHPSDSIESSLQHMSRLHGFSIPDRRFCTDVEGLITYLGLKVGAGRMCIVCPERRSSFLSLDACQKHMRDKQHCFLPNNSAEILVELADFYNYEEMYDEMKNESDLVDDGWTLTLPSGAKIGHRSLLRFYRQNLRERPVTAHGKPFRIADIPRAQFALAWTACTGVAAHRAAKDIQMMERAKRRFQLRVGVHSNKLFMSRGRSDQ